MLPEDGEAGRWQNATSWLQVPDSTRDNHACLVSSNRECFAHFNISYFFNTYSLSLYVYTQGILGCLFGFWPRDQNPVGATTFGWLINIFLTSLASLTHSHHSFLNNACRPKMKHLCYKSVWIFAIPYNQPKFRPGLIEELKKKA